MKSKTNLIDHFSQFIDNYTITNRQNGFLVEPGGQDREGKYTNAKYILDSVFELKIVVQDLALICKA